MKKCALIAQLFLILGLTLSSAACKNPSGKGLWDLDRDKVKPVENTPKEEKAVERLRGEITRPKKSPQARSWLWSNSQKSSHSKKAKGEKAKIYKSLSK